MTREVRRMYYSLMIIIEGRRKKKKCERNNGHEQVDLSNTSKFIIDKWGELISTNCAVISNY